MAGANPYSPVSMDEEKELLHNPMFLGMPGESSYNPFGRVEDDDFDPRRDENPETSVPESSRPEPPTNLSTPFQTDLLSQSVRRKEFKSEPEQIQPKTSTGTQAFQATESLNLEAIKLVLDSYADVVSRTTKERYKVPPVAIPKFKSGGDWRCFLAEFKEMIKLADLKPSHQLAYLKQAIPEEAKKMLYRHKVDAVDEALQMLTELYEPTKDSWQALQDMQKISQQSGERLRLFAGRLQDATRPMKLPPQVLDDLVKSRFKQALADSETRNLLLWDTEDVTLDEMVQKAQLYEDAKVGMQKSHKKVLKTSTSSDENSALKKKIEELEQKLLGLQQARDSKSRTRVTCWNCGRKGHFSRNCRQDKVGDGFTHRPKNKGRGRDEQKQKAVDTQTEEGLNSDPQGQ